MATAQATSPLTSLKAVNFRLSSTPSQLLPQLIPHITVTLQHCKPILSAPHSTSTDEQSVAIHKFKTRLNTLIGDASPEGRWAAIVLIKAAVELGGWEMLQSSKPWVRGLLSVLNKPDPSTSKKLAVVALTRVFMLQRQYPTLLREITTPSLPQFITLSLNCISPKPNSLALESSQRQLFGTVCESFAQLIPRHPTVFRPQQGHIQKVLVNFAAPTPSDTSRKGLHAKENIPLPAVTLDAARRVLTLLHHCAPKSEKSDPSKDWDSSIRARILSVHQLADKLFRAVIEDWQSTTGYAPVHSITSGPIESGDSEEGVLNLPKWTGIYAGGERLVGLLGLLKQYICSPSAATVAFPVDQLMDLLTRLFSIAPPTAASKNSQFSVRINNQISREEREALWTVLPDIHASALEILTALLQRFQGLSVSLVLNLLDQLTWLFSAEKAIAPVRAAMYRFFGLVLKQSGPSLPKQYVKQLNTVIISCCNDLHPERATETDANTAPASKEKQKRPNKGAGNADTFLNTSKSDKVSQTRHEEVDRAAYDLLAILLGRLPAESPTSTIRTRLDRTAVLLAHKDAMIASILNVPRSGKSSRAASSLMPILARMYPVDAEPLIRPRMPVIKVGARTNLLSEEQDMEDEEVELDEHEDSVDDAMDEDPATEEALDNITLVAQPTSQSDEKDDENVAMRDTINVRSSSPAQSVKRTIVETQASPSPKRVRLGSPIDTPVQASAAPVPAPPAVEQSVVVPQTSSFQPSPAAVPHAAPQAAAESKDDDSDDDDDFGELVLGQDTDEEDE